MPFKVVTMWCFFSWTQFLWEPYLQIVFLVPSKLPNIYALSLQPLVEIFLHCITGLSGSNSWVTSHSRGFQTFSKGYSCSNTSLTNTTTLRFRSCSWPSDQRDLWWIITAFVMMGLDSQLLASWWSTVHSFLSQNNVVLCLANGHSLVHPFLDVSLWVAGRLHISSSGSTYFSSSSFFTCALHHKLILEPGQCIIFSSTIHLLTLFVGMKHPIGMVPVLGISPGKLSASRQQVNWTEEIYIMPHLN